MSTLFEFDLERTPDPIRRRKNTEILNYGWKVSFDNVSFRNVNVPFPPQSRLSGIGRTDKFPVIYYKKTVNIATSPLRTLLCFGAVDYATEVYVNGKILGKHFGGYTPFSFDITQFIVDGENEIFLVVRDDFSGVASGKQTALDGSYGCFYTRVTGIWQSVYLERVPAEKIEDFYFYPDVKNSSVAVELVTTGDGEYSIEVFFEKEKVGEIRGRTNKRIRAVVPLSKKVLWSAVEGNLYNVRITFGTDEVFSYFGLREVGYDGYKFILNGEETYQKLVLLQGYYKDGIYTPSSVVEMQKDIDSALRLGFNGFRLHQKVFNPRFLYLCDKAGVICWGEFASWGVDYSSLSYLDRFLAEWKETLCRDFNHPSIVCWCPLNEVWIKEDPALNHIKFIDTVYDTTKSFDSTRPVVDVSGGYHGHKTDLYDFHCYESPENLKKYLNLLDKKDILDIPLLYGKNDGLRYEKGMPTHVSEFGGIPFGRNVSSNENMTATEWEDGGDWGYGQGVTGGEDFVSRYRELVEIIFSCDKVSGFCYTQLYDVEQEKNGLLFYDRTDKLTEKQKDEIKKINSGK